MPVLDTSPLEKSVAALERAANDLAGMHPDNPARKRARDDAVRCFGDLLGECMILMGRFSHEFGINRKPLRHSCDTLRIAGEEGLIDDAERWVTHHRLLSSIRRVRSEEKAEQAANSAADFLADAKEFSACLHGSGWKKWADVSGSARQDGGGGMSDKPELELILEERHRALARRILRAFAPHCEAWVFGSRATGRHVRKSSDLDIALISNPPMHWSDLENLREYFSASPLPMRVDVVTLDELPPIVRKNVEDEHVVLRRVNPADLAAAESE